MKKWRKQALSWLLVLAMMVQLMPLQVFAVSDDPIIATAEDGTPLEIVNDGRSDDATIVGEVTEARGEYEKHFRLSDGSFIAASYDTPVHYLDDGQWVDIDNTLTAVQSFDDSGTSSYIAVNDDTTQVFSADLSTGTVLTTESGNSSLTMTLWDGTDADQEALDSATTPEDSSLPADENADNGSTEDQDDNPDPAEGNQETEASAEDVADDMTIGDVHSDVPMDEKQVDDEAQAEPLADNASGEAVTGQSNDVPADPESDTTTVPEAPSDDISDDETAEETQLAGFNRNTEAEVLQPDDVGGYGLAEGDSASETWKKTDLIPPALSSSILYEDVYPNTDLQYDLFGYNIKESIILNQASAPANFESDTELVGYSYGFLMEFSNLLPVEREDGSILLVDSEEHPVYEIPAPYMMDAVGEFSDAVVYTLQEVDNGWLLTVTADAEWINDADRVFPVTIDPTIISKKNESNFVGATAAQYSATSSVSTSQMACGYHTTHGKMESFFKINNLPTVPENCTVVDAQVGLYLCDYIPQYNSAAKSVLEIHRITEPFQSTNWKNDLTWSTKPAYEESMDYVTTHGNEISQYLYWNVTRAAKQWYEGSATNYGLVLTSDQTASTAYRAWFMYQSQAVFAVSYRDMTGIEGYYTYEDQSAIRAGTGHVGDYSGFLTVEKPDVSYSNTAFPYGISHIFNSGLRTGYITANAANGIIAPDYSHMRFGFGWQLSAQESVKWTTISSEKYLVYRDGDGTQHYFAKDSTTGKYKDEDGLGLTITPSSTTADTAHTMTDDDGNTKYFRYGYLTYIQDANGNRICFLYNGKSYNTDNSWYPASSANYLSSIVSVNKGQAAKTICSFTYNSNYYLTSITDFAGRSTTFTYSGGHLTQITHPDGEIAYYNYNGDHLTSMFDGEALYGTEYTYSGNVVSGIKEYTAESNSSSKTYGTQVSRTKNGVQEALYRYDGNDRVLGNDDDLITRYAFDFGARTINATTLDSTQNTIYGVTAAAYSSNSGTSQKNNRIEKDAQTGQAGINLLIASGGETHDSFTTAGNYWLKTESGTGKSATVKTGERARTGSAALKIWLSANAAVENGHRRMGLYQSVSLQAGKPYTFSAYVNSQDVTSYADNNAGLYVAFLSSTNQILAESTRVTSKTNTDIENGWQRISVTFTPESAGTYRVAVMQEDAYSCGYFDDLQLEEGTAASSVNLIQDGTFTFSRNDDYDSNWNVTATHEREWNDTNLWLVGEDWYGNVSNRVGWIIGNKSGMKRGWQTVPINGPASETYLLSGWAKASSAADTEATLTSPLNNTKRYFGMIAQCNYTDNTKEYFYMPFNDDYTGWQYASCVIAPKKENQSKTIQNITVYMAYDYNINNALFDNISLRKEPCTTYTYDSKGNMTAVNASGNSPASFTYAAGTTKLTKSVTEANGTYTYEYNNANNNHLVTKIKNDGVSMAISYDTMGNSTGTTLSSDSNSSIGKIQTSAAYNGDGSLLTSQTNANGQTSTYAYASNRQVRMATNAANTRTFTVYSSGNDRASMSYISGIISTDYSYANGMLSQIRRGGFINQPNESTDKQFQTYNLFYDSFGNMTSIAVGSKVLASYQYASHNGSLQSMTYGNGDTVSYEYDALGRTSYELWNGVRRYQYLYSAEGNLAQKLDLTTGETVYYEYDSLGRLIRSSQSDTTGYIQRTEHLYDTENRISSQTWQMGSDSYTEKYTYSAADGSLTGVNSDDFTPYAYSYDALKRLSSKFNYSYKQSYTYQNRSDDSTKTTMLVSKLDFSARPDGVYFTPFSLNYAYDAIGNITSVTGSSVTGQNASYAYDAQGQLIQETNATGTYQYNYDTYGNIRSVTKDGVEAPVATYTYGNSEWVDLLTAYNGNPISYDAIGNPQNWYSSEGAWTPHWENGRQLSSLEPAGDNDSPEIEFTYDLAGIRSSKKVGNTTYNYITQNGKVVRQTWGSSHMDFIYDNNGNPYALKYNGYIYFYILNLQGDVIKVINYSGAEVASYTYDAWGNILSKSGWMADANPLRYRGYYYDKESGLYYLQSRYYDPVVKRFINADVAQAAIASGDFLSKNLFAYCNNCPTIADDQDGEWLNVVIGAVVGAGISAVVTAATGGSKAEIITSAATGFVSGAFAATGFGGTVGQAIIGAVTGGIDSGVGAYHDYKNKKVSLAGAIAKTVTGVAVGAAFGAMGAEGTGAFKKSCDITQKTGAAFRTLFRKSSVSKTAYRTARNTLKRTGKYIFKETTSSVFNGVSSSGISLGTTWYAGKYASWAFK